MAIEGGGEVTSGSHSPMLDVGIGLGYVPAGLASGGHRARDRRARTSRRQAQVVKKPIYAKEMIVAASESYPDDLLYHPRARLGAHRGRRGGARRHLVRAGRARRARPLRAAGRRRDGRQGRVVRRGRVGEGRLRPDLAALGRGARGQPAGRRRARDGQRGSLRRRLADPDPPDEPRRARPAARSSPPTARCSRKR